MKIVKKIYWFYRGFRCYLLIMWNNDNDLWDVYNDRVLCVYELNGFKIYIKIVIFNLKVII